MTSETYATGSSGLTAYVDGYLPDDDVLRTARARAAELGCASVEPAAGSALRFLAATLCARAVVEIGTGAGVSSLYLLRGMAPDGVLTSIDIEPEYHRAARKAFSEAGLATSCARLIMGRAADVLPRLTYDGYDLVFVDAAKVEYPSYYERGVPLLRPGGVIAFSGVLTGGKLADPARRDAETLAMREVARAIAADERLVPTLLPVGSGLLVASRVA